VNWQIRPPGPARLSAYLYSGQQFAPELLKITDKEIQRRGRLVVKLSWGWNEKSNVDTDDLLPYFPCEAFPKEKNQRQCFLLCLLQPRPLEEKH